MKTRTHWFLSSFIVAFIACGLTFRNTPSTARVTFAQHDTAFVNAAADAGMLEVQLGKLAAAKGTSAEVKKFGQSMVNDHTKANDELKNLAGKKGLQVPKTLSSKAQKTYEDVSKKTGADFDKGYAALMVKDHQEVIGKFKKESESGEDAEIKAWAKGKLSTLEHHLMMAQEMDKKVGGKN